jgi:hypothetical protein
LQINPLGSGFSRDHDVRVVSEVFNKGGALVSSGRIRNVIGAGMTFQPCLINLFTTLPANSVFSGI